MSGSNCHLINLFDKKYPLNNIENTTAAAQNNLQEFFFQLTIALGCFFISPREDAFAIKNIFYSVNAAVACIIN